MSEKDNTSNTQSSSGEQNNQQNIQVGNQNINRGYMNFFSPSLQNQSYGNLSIKSNQNIHTRLDSCDSDVQTLYNSFDKNKN